jgi:hypothetical protein
MNIVVGLKRLWLTASGLWVIGLWVYVFWNYGPRLDWFDPSDIPAMAVVTFGPPLTGYTIGHIVAWVIRGFKSGAAN